MKNNYSHRFLGALAAVSCLLLTGCLSTPPKTGLPPAPKGVAPELTRAETLPAYRMQIGDVIDVKLQMNPELNDQVTVRPDGKISTTLVDDVMAYGRSTREVAKDLEDLYGKQLLNPQISLLVRSFAPSRVYVTGEVTAPGEFINVGPNLTLVQAIARAGGLKNTAQPHNIVILRRGAGENPVAYAADYGSAIAGNDAASDVRLAPYDVVYVPRSGIADVSLHFEQYVRQFVPISSGLNYQLNDAASAPFK